MRVIFTMISGFGMSIFNGGGDHTYVCSVVNTFGTENFVCIKIQGMVDVSVE